MNAQDFRGLQEAYNQVYQLDEISQKTAIRAYAASKTGEFEGADSDRDLKRTDNLERHIRRKFGDKAVKHAERAADAQTFGRKDASGKSKKLPKPRIEKSDYRTTEDGKMHKQDQRELKTELRIKRDRRLRAARAANTNEQVDLYDIILSHLLDEGYAETLESAEVIMVNMSEEWIDTVVEEILDEENERRQTRRAARNMIDRHRTMTKGVAQGDRTGPNERRQTRRAARNMIDRYRTMTKGVDQGDRTGPEGYLRHRSKTGG